MLHDALHVVSPLYDISPAWIAGVGALLSGISATASAWVSVRLANKKARDECDRRIKEIWRSFDRGVRMQERREGDDDHEERWSHLE